jgi:hypothetical protein
MQGLPSVRDTKAIILESRPGNTTSQTGILINSHTGANLPFVYPNQLKIIPLQARSAAQTGSADSAASSILPTIDQPIDLVNFPRRSKFLIIPEQYVMDSHTLPPKEIPENELGPEYIHSWAHDQNDIGFDGLDNPNPINGLPPLNPVELQNTIQPNIALTNMEQNKENPSFRTRKKINNVRGVRVNKIMNRRMINIQNSVNDSIWGRKRKR